MSEMLDTVGKIVLVSDFIALIRNLGEAIVDWNSPDEKEKAAEALEAIRKATSATQDFIDNKGYVRATELETLWLTSMKRMAGMKGVGTIPRYLDSKARFWGRPQDWINNPSSLELVPKLHEIDEMCELLLRKIERGR